MDDYERQALFNSRDELYNSINIEEFLRKLTETHIISIVQRSKIQRYSSPKEKIFAVLRILSFDCGDCFHQVLKILKKDYPSESNKVELELLKERTSFSRDVNERLIEVINEQLIPIVQGTQNEKFTGISRQNSKTSIATELSPQSPNSSITTLSDLIKDLQRRCLRILNIKPSEARQTSVPALINRKIKEQQEMVKQLKTEISEIKGSPKKKSMPGDDLQELTQSAKIYLLRKELEDQHIRVRRLQYTLHSKESTICRIKSDNSKTQKEIDELRKQNFRGKFQANLLFDDIT